MIDYIIFEKKPDGDRPAWTLDLAKEFCEEQKHDVVSYEDSVLFIVAKLASATEDGEKNYRHLELTSTLSFLIQDDPSLDDFLEPEIPRDHPMTFARREQVATIVEESKDEDDFKYF